jgi:putative membrane protein
MTMRWLFAALHLLALGIGLGAVWSRARALRALPGEDALRRVFTSDAWWGIAGLLWIGTGLMRAFGGLEKGSYYYLRSDAFLGKMGLLAVILLLELWPMTTLIRWRMQRQRGESPDLGRAATFARISEIQALLVILMVFAATAMARGLGY